MVFEDTCYLSNKNIKQCHYYSVFTRIHEIMAHVTVSLSAKETDPKHNSTFSLTFGQAHRHWSLLSAYYCCMLAYRALPVFLASVKWCPWKRRTRAGPLQYWCFLTLKRSWRPFCTIHNLAACNGRQGIESQSRKSILYVSAWRMKYGPSKHVGLDDRSLAFYTRARNRLTQICQAIIYLTSQWS